MQSAVRSVFLYQNVKTILCMQKETFSFGKYRNKFKPLMKKLTFLQFLKKDERIICNDHLTEWHIVRN